MNASSESTLATRMPREAGPASLRSQLRTEPARTRAIFALVMALNIGLQGATEFWFFAQDATGTYITLHSVVAAIVAGSVWWGCIALADAFEASGRLPHLGYAVASICSGVLICMVFQSAQLSIFEPRKAGMPPLLSLWWQILGATLLQTTLFTAAYRYRVRTLASAARWQDLRLDRALLTRKATEARLHAMQARVDPQFLADALAEIERSSAGNLDRADRMLEALITYLRRALPSVDADSATLDAEVSLVRAYFELLRLHINEPSSITIEISDPARRARMPPMLLLPLMEHTVGSVRSRGFDAVLVTGSVEGNRLRLEIAGSAPGPKGRGKSGVDLGPLRDRLAALFGLEASLIVASDDPESLHTILEIPYERTERRDR
jgi:hypothetical protein